MHSERHEELVSLAALGLPLEDDAAEYARLVEERCPDCEALLPELRLAASSLAAAVPLRRPRPSLHDELLASLGPRRPEARPSRSAAWTFAAVAAVLFVMIGLDDARLRRQREELRARNSQLALAVETGRSELARRDLRTRVLESDDVRLLFLG